MPLQTWQTIWN